MMDQLLPTANSTKWEKTMAKAMDTVDTMAPAISLVRGIKITNPPPSFLPYLIYEYGLGELTPYVPNLYDLINEGIDWQRVRGTPEAMRLALAWLGYTAVIEEESTLRRYWNLFQLRLDRVRDVRSDLARIEGVAGLSVPARSVFWRGFHGLDIRPMSWSQRHFSEAHYGEYSGVRLHSGGPLWSFGRSYDFDVTLTQAELTELGVWLDPVEGSTPLGWGPFSWNSSTATWVSSAAASRSQSMSSGVVNRRAWFVFMDADGDVIGYRRARAHRWVSAQAGGVYSIGGLEYAARSTVQTRIYLECQTGFGDGDGSVAASVGVVLDGQPVDDAAPGKQWLLPNEIEGATDPVAVNPINIVFGESIRERVKMLFHF